MFLYYLVRRAPGRQALLSFSVAAVLCLVWLVPTLEGFASQWGASSTVAYSANSFARDSPIFHGITLRSMANVARFAVPLTIAFWPLLGSILGTFSKLHNESVGLLWIWIAPGAAFMVLIYMGDAPYLTYLTAAVLLLALKQLDSAAPRLRTLLVAFCAAFNIVFFLFFVPIRSKSFAVNVLNLYAGKYTRFAIRNQWQPNLSDLIDRNTLQPRQ